MARAPATFSGSSNAGGFVTVREVRVSLDYSRSRGHAPAAGITYDPEAAFVQDSVSGSGLSQRSTKLRGHSGGSSDLIPHSNPSLARPALVRADRTPATPSGQPAAGSGA